VFNPIHDFTHTAPELLPRDPLGFKVTSHCYYATDVWNFGSLMYNLITGIPPCSGIDQANLFQAIRSYISEFDDNHLLKSTPNQLQKLLRECLQRDPERRISIQQIVTHDYFADK
jgi:serine/threonine protein kinase